MRKSLLLAGVAGAAVAQPHNHAHRRGLLQHHHHGLDKRAVVEQLVTVTVLECVLDGRQLSELECNEGVKNGTLRFIEGDAGEANPAVTTILPSHPTPAPGIHAELQPVQPAAAAPPSPAVEAQPAAVEPQPKPAVAVNNRVSSSSSSSGSSNANAGATFPSGELDCSEFPSAYGAVRADWLNLGGWLSVQQPGQLVKRGGFSNIMTVVPEMCAGGACCKNGAFCSYACPAGYFKTQWPATQGSTGQSVGGLLCENGKLVLSNPSATTLCQPSAKQVTALVKNTMNEEVSICQTNYPGDEGMTIPIVVPAGATVPLPVLDMPNYWRTRDGSMTSAQYYVNPAGVPHEKACQWKGTNTGNWAPMVIGAGFNGKEAFLSLFGNAPTQTKEVLDYKIEMQGQVSMPCRYSGGQICSGQGYGNCNSPLRLGSGCTVAVTPGNSMTFVLSN